MIQAGFTTIDPRTGTRIVVIQGAAETGGTGWVLETTCPAHAAPSVPEHFHLGWTETFEILQGEARYRLDGQERTAGQGESVVMPAGQRHIHPWNAGSEALVYRQSNDFGRQSPEAVDDVLGVFATLHALVRDGKVNDKGEPKNPLQLAAMMRTLVKHDGFDAAAPAGLQRFLSATLGRLAEWLGYRGADPRLIRDES